MVVYVDGKPIFVQNPTPTNFSATSPPNEQISVKTLRKKDTKPEKGEPPGHKPKSFKRAPSSGLVTKIPYLLAAASNHRKQQSHIQNYQSLNCHENMSAKRSYANPVLGGSAKRPPTNQAMDLKRDQEYLQLVSMLRQKNEKLLFQPTSLK